MNYDIFSKWLKEELPFNRKEKFFTATVLPALLFNCGLSNFYHFLRTINNFPAEVNEKSTKDNFIFFTEYNLKEASGDRNIGQKISTERKYTPDVIIEIIEPKIFIIIEAKMFEKISESKLKKQIMEQKMHVAEPLKRKFGLEDNRVYHIALVPKALGITDERQYQVINWEFFIDNGNLKVKDNYFYNYLRFALENYKDLVQKKSGQATTVEDYMNGAEVYQRGSNGKSFWVGRKGGRMKIIEEIKSNQWNSKEYSINYKSLVPPTKQWISVKEFIELVDKYGKE